jgi:hypothetical protein
VLLTATGLRHGDHRPHHGLALLVGDPQYPHLAPTYWRSVADSTDKVYYFESTLIGNIHANLAPVQPIGFLRP